VNTRTRTRTRRPALPRPRSTRTGDVRDHPAFGSGILGNERDVTVYLPPGYKRSKRRYPVLYMQDGQNVFDAATSAFGVEWCVDEAAESLIGRRRIEPMIVVAIDNTPDRKIEYSAPIGRNRGHADSYGRFLVEELKPFIDQTYRTCREGTAVAGSSLGANVALYVASRYPQLFSGCAALSPAIWWQGDGLVREVAAAIGAQRIAVFVGTHEGPNPKARRHYVQGARRLVRALRSEGRRVRYREVRGGGHNEADWARQVPAMLRHLFPRA
jgi:predicted alpha/beta superfamily hydrolase